MSNGDTESYNELVESLSADSEQDKPIAASFWKVWTRRLAVTLLIGIVCVAIAIYALVQMAQVEPDFYQQALEVDPSIQKTNGSQMEARILNLRNAIIVSDSWSTSFPEEQINGWLAWDLVEKFPGLIPQQIIGPTVAIGDSSLKLAFRYESEPLHGVAVVDCDFFVTGVVNQVGIRIKSIHAGLIPIPVAYVADAISEYARRAGFDIRWDNEEKYPIAIFDLPDAFIKPKDGSYVELETLQIEDGNVFLSGKTHPPDF